jgi:hypothetical protein
MAWDLVLEGIGHLLLPLWVQNSLYFLCDCTKADSGRNQTHPRTPALKARVRLCEAGISIRENVTAAIHPYSSKRNGDR